MAVADLPVAHVRGAQSLLLGVFAFIAILLASIGLYGLMAYSVKQQTREFGIRLALGANGPALRNMVVGQAMKLALLGIVAGLAAAYGLTRLMRWCSARCRRSWARWLFWRAI